MERRDFTGPDDLRAMQRLCSRVWAPEARFHPGQLAWSRYFLPVEPDRPPNGEAIAAWWDGEEVVGLGWAEADDWLEVQVDPAYGALVADVVDWFEGWSAAPSLSVMTMEGDASEAALHARGYQAQQASWYFRHHLLDLRALPPAPPTPGYVLRSVEPHEAAERAACHRAAWSDDAPSRVTAESYGALMHAWPYRCDLDWVAVDDAGQLVASALVWLDPTTGVGLLEPVGCAPAHRGRGLAGAVVLAALHHLRRLGARTAMVSPRGDDGHPGPQRLYQSLGFRPGARTLTWTRTR